MIMDVLTFVAGAVLMLVSVILVGVLRDKEGTESQRDTEGNGGIGKVEFDTVCAVMHLLRCGKVGRETPNWQVYSEVKKWKEVSHAV